MQEQEQYLSVIKFPAFVSLALIILSALYAIFLSSALKATGMSHTQSFIFTAVLIILLLLVAYWAVILMSTHLKLTRRWLQRSSKWMLVHIYYPLARSLGTILLTNKQTLVESFLNFNNEMVLTDQIHVRNESILVLLPHCLQSEECGVRITNDIVNCEECGRCDIATIKKLTTTHNVLAAVASGGSLARRLIAEKKPHVIIAVACHRDLVDGVRDAWRFPVYAILNERPNGPCNETKVSIATIEFAINRFK
jgi:uncharacterized protein